MHRINRPFEQAKLRGLFELLESHKNGRSIHRAKNIQSALWNWIRILDTKPELNDVELVLFEEIKREARELIKQEMRLKH